MSTSAPKSSNIFSSTSQQNINLESMEDADRRDFKFGNHLVENSDLKLKNAFLALSDYEEASKGKIALTRDGFKAFGKIFTTFKITQIGIDSCKFIYGRMKKEPLVAKMDENMRILLNDLAGKKYKNHVDFDPVTYMAYMDKLVLGDTKLPKKAYEAFNLLLLSILNKDLADDEAILNAVNTYVNQYASSLTSTYIDIKTLEKIAYAHALPTPKILLVHAINNLHIDRNQAVKTLALLSQKTVAYYDRRIAMSLHAKAVADNKVQDHINASSSFWVKSRELLNKINETCMNVFPLIYAFMVGNLIIDRQLSGPRNADLVQQKMDEHFSVFDNGTDSCMVNNNYFNATSAYEDIYSSAYNYLTKSIITNSLDKGGNIAPSFLASAMYLFSTFTLCINVRFPEHTTTYINEGMTQLLTVYMALNNEKLKKSISFTHDDGTDPLLPISTPVEADNEAEETDKISSKSFYSLDKQHINESTATEVNKSLPRNDTPHNPKSHVSVSIEGTSFVLKNGEGQTIKLDEIEKNQAEYSIDSKSLAQTIYKKLDGPREGKIGRVFQIFSEGLIGLRAIWNTALELKDFTPDVPVRNWIYDFVILKIIIPFSCVENRGFIDRMSVDSEKARIYSCLSKLLENEELTKSDEDFLQGVFDTYGGYNFDKVFTTTNYGNMKIVNSILTLFFLTFHVGLIISDVSSAIASEDGKSVLSPLFDSYIGVANVKVLYQLLYRPILEVFNGVTFAAQHGYKNVSTHYYEAILQVIGRSVTAAPALPLWAIGTTNFDTIATLIDSAGTTGHDKSADENFRKARLDAAIDLSSTLIHTFTKAQNLWSTGIREGQPNTNAPPTTDFAEVLSYRLEQVSKDLIGYMQAKGNHFLPDVAKRQNLQSDPRENIQETSFNNP